MPRRPQPLRPTEARRLRVSGRFPHLGASVAIVAYADPEHGPTIFVAGNPLTVPEVQELRRLLGRAVGCFNPRE